MDETRTLAYEEVRGVAKRLREARDAYEDAKSRFAKLGNQSEDTKEFTERIRRLDDTMDEVIRRITTAENEIKALKAECHNLSVEIGNLREELAKLEPEQKRIAVADRAARTVAALLEKLKPVTTSRLEEHVTNHFRSIADPRFRNGRITFTHDGEPHLQFEGGSKSLLSSMSGFERRSFGIAFSLALAEITRRRVPLIIDTPLGNADSKYRPRTLDALRKFDCDQVIILTHDREVTADLLDHIDGHVCQKFLVEFDEKQHRSLVHPNRFFFEDR